MRSSCERRLWTPLVAVDQKANPAYAGFYNGGGLRPGGMARGSGERKSPSGIQGQSPGRGPGGQSTQKLKQNVKLVYSL